MRLLPSHRVLWTTLGLASLLDAATAARPTVTIADGAIAGVATSVPGAAEPAVHKYLGIPFAASPPLRFALPSSPKPWKKVLDASKVSPACLQQFSNSNSTKEFEERVFNPGTPPESEDCLYLNVFTPASPAPAGGRAVMFWIYGGNLQFGDAGLTFYDGSSFAANQDVIVVTTNYRTNVFGYSNSPEIPTEKNNAGFFDQRKALAWVQSNIHAFGGNRRKVTIFGESAGGYSVKQLVILPPKPRGFRAAIMESQAAATAPGGAAEWQALTAQLGCADAASPLACMRTKPGKAIRDAVEQGGYIFSPVPDGITQAANVPDALAAGTTAKVPVLLGTNGQEGRVFVAAAGADPNVTAGLISMFPNLAPLGPIGNLPFEQASQVVTDLEFTCTTSVFAGHMLGAGYRVWRYYFNATIHNLQTFPDAGAYHSVEIPLVFGTYPQKGKTAREVKLSSYMQTAWATFAKHPVHGPGWPQYTTAKMTVGDLGGRGSAGEFDIDASEIDSMCPSYQGIILGEGQN